jgi:hypothetical protein
MSSTPIKNRNRWLLPISEIISASELDDMTIIKMLQIDSETLALWRDGHEPHYLMKRGVVTVLYSGRGIGCGTAKKWNVIKPDGTTETVINLHEFCRRNGLPISATSSFSNKGFYGLKSNRYFATPHEFE